MEWARALVLYEITAANSEESWPEIKREQVAKAELMALFNMEEKKMLTNDKLNLIYLKAAMMGMNGPGGDLDHSAGLYAVPQAAAARMQERCVGVCEAIENGNGPNDDLAAGLAWECAAAIATLKIEGEAL